MDNSHIVPKYQTEVPPSVSQVPPAPYSPTLYDYLALAPSILVALTSVLQVVLQYRRDKNKDKDK